MHTVIPMTMRMWTARMDEETNLAKETKTGKKQEGAKKKEVPWSTLGFPFQVLSHLTRATWYSGVMGTQDAHSRGLLHISTGLGMGCIVDRFGDVRTHPWQLRRLTLTQHGLFSIQVTQTELQLGNIFCLYYVYEQFCFILVEENNVLSRVWPPKSPITHSKTDPLYSPDPGL